jgi:hypothetical protein
MENSKSTGKGIQLLVKKYKDMFHIPENLNYYSKIDYKTAERKFLQYKLTERTV